MCYNRIGGFMKYEIGKKVVGVVSGITEYGVFVKFDEYYSGLIHISEISDKFVCDINDYVKIGDKIKVKVIDIDNDKNQLKLSIKNFNYKNTSNRKYEKIVETSSGFKTLGQKRNFWINEYLKNKKISKYY